MGGYWNVIERVCNLQIFADNICYRVVKKDGKWVLDKDKCAFGLCFTVVRRSFPRTRPSLCILPTDWAATTATTGTPSTTERRR